MKFFVLDNQFDDFYSDYDKYDRDQKGHFLYTNDEDGYKLTKDVLQNKKSILSNRFQAYKWSRP